MYFYSISLEKAGQQQIREKKTFYLLHSCTALNSIKTVQP